MTEYLYRVTKRDHGTEEWVAMDRRYLQGQKARTYSDLGTARGVKTYLERHRSIQSEYRIERVPNSSWETVPDA